jgi:threonylcarbamoyladenosine tRNA methylthiotransferase MtaB
MPRVALHTLGCKLNYAETAAIAEQFLDRGFALVPFGDDADVCIINTCSVTARADRECRQMIRRARRTSRNPFVIVTGCYAQLAPEEVASIEGVDLVLGAKEKCNLFQYAGEFQKGGEARICVSDIDLVDSFGPAFSTAATDRTRAFLKIQDGCDFNCSFCTIPLARGTSRSQSIGDTLAQARMLVEHGYREIVLTGVNVGDYGKKSGTSLIGLLHALVQVDGLERLRISSIEPNLLSQEIIDFTAESPVLCNHFHIPLQSGSDAILRGMRRRYTTGMYRELIHRIRERIPGCGVGVDVIVGFPGETGAHVEETSRFLTELPVSYLHVFTYSERPNTPAAASAQPVAPAERFRRSALLRLLGQKKKQAFYASMIGRKLPVLVEGETDECRRFGFTDNYVRVGLPHDVAENTIVHAELTGAADGYCIGVVTGQEMAA